ncbi:MobV family relaxase [Neptuniibacter pectenicola]|uniref:MobV family relaxase n=1 Tax=Neptuniibacter pectenicola TaxID=1806669 RepID=A0ABU9TWB4_9GAMM
MKFSDKYAEGIEEQKAKARLKKAQRQGDAANRKNANKSKSGSSSKPAKVKAVRVPKAVLRIAKIKTHTQIKAAGNHTHRHNETPNCDPAKSHLNETLVGSKDLFADYLKALGDVKERKNGVKLVEHVLSASPEYFRPENPEAAGEYDKSRMEAWKEATMDFLHKEYGSNLINAELHLSENTPHIHVFLIPLDRDKNPEGKLNASKWFDGKEKLSSLQDRYADALKPIHIERGLKKSKAKHQSIKSYYSAVNSADNKPTPNLKPSPFTVEKAGLSARLSPEEYAQEQVDLALKQQQESFEKQHKSQIRIAAIKAADRDQAVQRSKELERTARGYKQAYIKSEILRDLPLDQIAEELGLSWDRRKKQFKSEHHAIAFKGQKFKDFKMDNRVVDGKKLGGGAIDLVMHVENCSFKQAKDFLASCFGVERVAGHEAINHYRQAAQEIEKKELIMPQPVPEYLEHVKCYLIEERKLSPKVLEVLIEKGDLYADERKNAVFVCRNLKGKVTGAEKVGTSLSGWKGVATGTDHSAGVVLCEGIESGGQPEKIVFVESSIDALSYTQMNPTHAAISTAGKKAEFIENNKIALLRVSNYSLACGWDNAPDANKAYQDHFAEDLVIGRVIPDEGKDWNDQLKAEFVRESEDKELQKLKHDRELKKKVEQAIDAEKRRNKGTKWGKEKAENYLMTPSVGNK